MAAADKLRSILARAAETAGGIYAAFSGGARSHRHRPGVGERVMASTQTGGTMFGYPGGWGQNRYEQVQHFRHFVYIAIRARGNFMASLTPNVGWVNQAPTAHKSGLKSFAAQRRCAKSLHAIRPHEEVEHAPIDHPLVRLLEEPNEWDTAGDLWSQLDMFWDLTGNAYLWIVPNGAGMPCEAWVIPSHWIQPRIDPGRGVRMYEMRPWGGMGEFFMPPEEIIHFQDPNPLHKLDGWSALQASAEWVDVAESIDQSRFWSMKNGAFPWGHLELDPQYYDPDDNDIERIYAKVFARLQGEQRHGMPLITGPGIKYNPLMIAPSEMLFEKSAEQLRDWILATFHVPKEIAGIQDAGSEIAMYGPLRQFIMQSINPRLRQKAQILTRHLARRWDADLRIWWNDETPESPEELRAKLTLLAANGGTTPNEMRAMLLDLEPFENGGDDPLVPMGTAPMPLNTGEDLSDLTDLMPQPLTGPRGGKIAQGGDAGDESETGAEAKPGVPALPTAGEFAPDEGEEAEEPDGKPSVAEAKKRATPAVRKEAFVKPSRNGYAKRLTAADFT